ncbi:MAG: hypothetical protein JSR46_05915 [Verrucomicrobia bacterium]|nr:hypothetical protein [Verrucomicrobiota bacterium]
MEKTEDFEWVCHPQAEEFIAKILNSCCEKNEFLSSFKTELIEKTSTRLFDWVDHIELGGSDVLQNELQQAGFVAEVATPFYRTFFHPAAKLPLIVVKDQSHPFIAVAILVESIADFLMVRGESAEIEGSQLSTFRRACISKEQGVFVHVVERRGAFTMEPTIFRTGEAELVLQGYENWQTRPRAIDDEEQEEEEIGQAITIAEELVEALGTGLAASIVLDVERKYWQSKNRAGQIQKNRQDSLGLGWANHDHHTFRSSRRYFHHLVRLFEVLGFTCRECFYAGREAGWGAQVMEHKQARLVLFLDVDLSPEEVGIDFAHRPLDDKSDLGTVGLWCALHGESILKAGMHHLEAQFIFDKLGQDLTQQGVSMMAPFTNLAYLKQAFTVGDHWPVAPVRIERLLARGQITKEQAERFKEHGALGSHLENLQRNEGYKGFHKKSVSTIIQKTDPRNS